MKKCFIFVFVLLQFPALAFFYKYVMLCDDWFIPAAINLCLNALIIIFCLQQREINNK